MGGEPAAAPEPPRGPSFEAGLVLSVLFPGWKPLRLHPAPLQLPTCVPRLGAAPAVGVVLLGLHPVARPACLGVSPRVLWGNCADGCLALWLPLPSRQREMGAPAGVEQRLAWLTACGAGCCVGVPTRLAPPPPSLSVPRYLEMSAPRRWGRRGSPYLSRDTSPAPPPCPQGWGQGEPLFGAVSCHTFL